MEDRKGKTGPDNAAQVRWAMLVDLGLCIGCHSCSVACKRENEVPLGVFRTWVKVVESGRYPQVKRGYLPINCNQCERPVCVEVCPVKATYQRADGIVLVDPHRCIGCEYCKAACPYEVRHMDPLRGIISKCYLCHHRLDAGGLPACVEACPTGARQLGNLKDPRDPLVERLSSVPVQVLLAEHGTRPQVFYVGLDETWTGPRGRREP